MKPLEMSGQPDHPLKPGQWDAPPRRNQTQSQPFRPFHRCSAGHLDDVTGHWDVLPAHPLVVNPEVPALPRLGSAKAFGGSLLSKRRLPLLSIPIHGKVVEAGGGI